MYQHILIATDGSELSEKAVHAGVDLAKRLGAKATFFTSSPDFRIFETDSSLVAVSRERYASECERRANIRLATGETYATSHGVQHDTVHVFAEHPYEAIIKAVAKNKCDLVVMASHGRRGVAGVLLGSETTKVLKHCKVPVLVCR